LVVGLVLARCDGSRLPVSFRDEFRGPYVGHPDLNRPKALGAQTLAMFADPLSCASHTAMLHVTNAILQPCRPVGGSVTGTTRGGGQRWPHAPQAVPLTGAQVPPRSLDPCIRICRRVPNCEAWGPSSAGGYCFAASSGTTSADIECSAPCHADHIPAATIWAMVIRGLTVAASRLDEDMGHVKRHGAS
jgi:hypothetical protein